MKFGIFLKDNLSKFQSNYLFKFKYIDDLIIFMPIQKGIKVILLLRITSYHIAKAPFLTKTKLTYKRFILGNLLKASSPSEEISSSVKR